MMKSEQAVDNFKRKLEYEIALFTKAQVLKMFCLLPDEHAHFSITADL